MRRAQSRTLRAYYIADTKSSSFSARWCGILSTMYTAIFIKKCVSGYVAWFEEIPGVNTQGVSKKEVKENLADVPLGGFSSRVENLRKARTLSRRLNRSRTICFNSSMKRADFLRHLRTSGCEFVREEQSTLYFGILVTIR